MRTIVAGSRTMRKEAVYKAIETCPWPIAVVVSGTARGADRAGETWARERGLPVMQYPAAWHTHGKAAGHIRNEEMARRADALVLVWDGRSAGSRNMKHCAMKHGLRIHEAVVEGK